MCTDQMLVRGSDCKMAHLELWINDMAIRLDWEQGKWLVFNLLTCSLIIIICFHSVSIQISWMEPFCNPAVSFLNVSHCCSVSLFRNWIFSTFVHFLLSSAPYFALCRCLFRNLIRSGFLNLCRFICIQEYQAHTCSGLHFYQTRKVFMKCEENLIRKRLNKIEHLRASRL